MGFKKEQDLVNSLKWRYAVKQFDPTRKIPAETWQALEQALVLTPSSYGLQPWKFLIITNQALREKLVPHSWNQRQVTDCSHLVVFLTKLKMTSADIRVWIEQLAKVRGTSPEQLTAYEKMMRSDIIEGPRSQHASDWAARQSYIALGNLMTCAATLLVDTCPMEGFIPEKYDEILELKNTGWTTTVLCPCGYRSIDDKASKMIKVRFDAPQMIEHIL